MTAKFPEKINDPTRMLLLAGALVLQPAIRGEGLRRLRAWRG